MGIISKGLVEISDFRFKRQHGFKSPSLDTVRDVVGMGNKSQQSFTSSPNDPAVNTQYLCVMCPVEPSRDFSLPCQGPCPQPASCKHTPL